jgi:hypothetical protein
MVQRQLDIKLPYRTAACGQSFAAAVTSTKTPGFITSAGEARDRADDGTFYRSSCRERRFD